MNRTTSLFLATAMLSLTVGVHASAQGKAAKGVEFFEAKIRPVLVQHCYQCHSAAAQKGKKLRGGLLLDSKAGLLQGGDSGPAVVPGKPQQSRLIKALHYHDQPRMPPKGKLSNAVLADFDAWVAMGAPDPRDSKARAPVAAFDWNKARQTWAFQTPVKHTPPKVKDGKWPRKELDWFVLAELEQRGLKPVGSANKRELLRRATFDLIGLPPTPEEVAAFLKDDAPDAFAKVVDRLLASPHYGERWGRYWLDVARYAEDKALAFANTRPHAFHYRDWVVQALNSDMPYDRFVRLQIAGDLLADPEPDYFIKLAGLGFQGLGQEYHRGSVTAQVLADELDDRIDTLSRGLLGLTVACARCHDHKYDPIPTRDYYSLAAAYNGSNLTVAPLAAKEAVARRQAWEKKSKEMTASLAQWLREQTRVAIQPHVAETGRYLQIAWQLRVLRQHNLPNHLAVVAAQEKLHPMFLERALTFLKQGKWDKQDAAVKAWLAVMEKVTKTTRPLQGKVTVPAELAKATQTLHRDIEAALQKGKAKNPPNLLKTLWLNPNALFFVSDKEAPAFLSEPLQKELSARKLEWERLQQEAPSAPLLAHVISGGGQAMPVYLRGNVERPSEQAPPGFLRILSTPDATGPSKFTRRELAEVIASAKNPLTARVLVNRVWHYHFGRGIVGTTSNFGQLGDRPTHPELLDTLAVHFMEAGWSLRWLHREMMLSTTYQLASAAESKNVQRDPENHYLWRFAPRRLDFEAWRDAWLAVSGRLDAKRGGPSLDLNQPDNVRRTLYARVSRLEANKLMVLFDFPDANVTSDRRSVTTVPQQQLFVLNSDFTVATAKAFAGRLTQATKKDPERVALAFRLAYGREPSQEEMDASLEFVRGASTQERLAPWEQFAQALLASNEFQWID